MNKIKSGFRSLLSRSSRNDATPKISKSGVKIKQGEEDSLKSPQLVKKKSFVAENDGFNVFQAHIYTKKGRDDYEYGPVPEIKKELPVFQLRIDPPDDIPFKLSFQEEEQYKYFIITAITPPASPTLRSEFRRPHLKINTRLPESWTTAPLSPPISAGVQSPGAQLPIDEYEYQSPTRAAPSPPMLARSPPTSSPLLNAPDDILIQIFSNLDLLSSMGSLALTHSRLHNVLVPNKLFIIRGVVHNMSPPAHNLVELLRSTETCTAKTYSEDYEFSLEVVSALKVLIQSRCRFFLSPEKLDFHNLAAERAFNDALYNIWAFCLTFRNQVGDVKKQMKWFRRFKSAELMDVLEIWQCLGVLLRPLMDCPELARKHGVIQSRPLTSSYSTEVAVELEEWISFVQTKGLDTLKQIVEWPETEHTQRYAIIEAKGLNKWQKQQDRPYTMFLRDAANKVYGELLLAQEPKPAPISPVGTWGPTTDF